MESAPLTMFSWSRPTGRIVKKSRGEDFVTTELAQDARNVVNKGAALQPLSSAGEWANSRAKLPACSGMTMVNYYFGSQVVTRGIRT